MRIYSAISEEDLRTRDFLQQWAKEGYLSQKQYQSMEQETEFFVGRSTGSPAGSELKRTNIFLRLVLFLFTVIIVAAAAGLVFVIFVSHPSGNASGLFFLIFSLISYVAAERAAIRWKLYRHGIEEALAVCSVAFLCAGLQSFSASQSSIGYAIPIAATVSLLWLWHRFGFAYAFPAAMMTASFLPAYWISSRAAQLVILAALFAIGLACVAFAHARHRFDYLDKGYSLVEAFLWLGIYLAINLQIRSLNPLGAYRAHIEWSRFFYWSTWVLTWCLPPVVLMRGIREKDRLVIAVGAILATLTMVTNKPYLGWERQTWDPMLFGALVIGVALLLRRWLASGQNGIRHGFTAERITEKDQHWMDSKSAVFGMMAQGLIVPGGLPATHTRSTEAQFGGGDTGGGGATSDF